MKPSTSSGCNRARRLLAMAMHYPRRTSKIKRARMFGFRARMKTKNGRKMINRKRRVGRRLTPSS
ncbi:MAG: 50S ribosomal protein L34 [Phycisphaerae bacterium]|nr:50S ribosomal protein L34 [Phycisphaerae bacterium]